MGLDCSSGVVDRLCVACQEGKFRSVDSALNSDMCMACSVCPNGYKSQCTPDSDAVCLDTPETAPAAVGLTQDIRQLAEDRQVQADPDVGLTLEERQLPSSFARRLQQRQQ